jgi:hypothetical protein
MADKSDKWLVREGESSRKTERGLEIPLRTSEDFFGALKKALGNTWGGLLDPV